MPNQNNSGQTPAYKFACQIKITAGTFPQTDFTISKEESDPAAYLGPSGVTWNTPLADRLLTDKEAEEITQGTSAIYVFGNIRYVDAFGVPRLTTFRAIARGQNGFIHHEEGKRDVLMLAFDKEGNEAD